GVRASEDTLADIAAFLKSLTDERVRLEKALFDHPALPLPDGHSGDEHAVDGEAGLRTSPLAETVLVEVPAVGASGRDEALGPLRAFADRMQPRCATSDWPCSTWTSFGKPGAGRRRIVGRSPADGTLSVRESPESVIRVPMCTDRFVGEPPGGCDIVSHVSRSD